ncbi:hypothetical protein CLPU_6c00700 [Gottschalkia purinilytica]|uniref:YdbS-like PH domain-containing protein n=1 Tax=Gottschalkia purinilytica TaxID=1503 RepID=A0A0L0WAP8_GOTPU|nr:PH domain-containing protein [Gottschalkia purinilytica]KNF08584.1 hypothetical protein CLPU_6c00700 [Gottschalkia purinilytica]
MEYKKQHIYFLFSKLISSLESAFCLFAICIAITKNSYLKEYIISFYFILGTFLITLTYSILQWHRNIYAISDNYIYTKSGILNINERRIPFAKIQTIDISSSYFQRLYNICSIQIETPGSSDECEVQMILDYNTANNIREIILKNNDNKITSTKNITTKDNKDIDSDMNVVESESICDKNIKSIYTFKPSYMIIKSLTSFKWLVVLPFGLTFYSFFDDYMPKKSISKLISDTGLVLNKIFNRNNLDDMRDLFLIFFIMSVIFSIINTIVKYHNFSLSRKNNNIKISYGLSNKKEISIPVNRISSIKITESIFKKLFGFAEISIESIGYGNEDGEESILCPFIKANEINSLISDLLPEVSLNYNFKKVSNRSLYYYVLESITLPTFFFIAMFFYKKYYGYIFMILPIFMLILGFYRYKNAGISYYDNILIISLRKFSLCTIIIPKSKIQSIESRQNPIQKINDIYTLNINIQGEFVHDNYKVKGFSSDIISNFANWFTNKKLNTN